jgi:hypothetical protein
MAHSMWLVRRCADGSIEPMGEPIRDDAVVHFMHGTDLGGIVAVEPAEGFAGFDYLVTFTIEYVDAQGTVEYLTSFDPHVVFPEVPATSHWIMHHEA